MKLTVLGLDFRTAPVALREQVAMSSDQVARLLEVVATEKLLAEAMIVSTCNRTEFYLCDREDPAAAFPHLLGHVARIKGIDPMTQTDAIYRHDGIEAVRHLFRVCGSLESQVVGEHEIMGQVKTAYKLACDARTARFLLHKLTHWAFRAGKRVMTETALGQGTASVAQAAVDLAGQIFAHLEDKTVMVIGAGATAESAAQALLRSGVRRLIVADRTLYKAEKLAGDFVQWLAEHSAKKADDEPHCPALREMLAECRLPDAGSLAAGGGRHATTADLDARAIGLETIASAIGEADVVISSTGSQEPVLTKAQIGPVLAGRRRPLLMIDIAVPRDIEPELGKVPSVFLYNIDALEAMVDLNVRRRMTDVPKASAIVEDEVAEFQRWFSSLGVVPTIQELEQRLRTLQLAEVDKYLRKVPPEARVYLQELARTLCNRILHDPIVYLKELGDRNGSADLSTLQTLRDIFRLDSTEGKK